MFDGTVHGERKYEFDVAVRSTVIDSLSLTVSGKPITVNTSKYGSISLGVRFNTKLLFLKIRL